MRSFGPLNFARAVIALLCAMLLGSFGSTLSAADPKVIEAAKKEGELGWWSTIAQDQSQKIIEEFMKVYPFIKANYWRSGSVGIHNKVLIEARAGRPEGKDKGHAGENLPSFCEVEHLERLGAVLQECLLFDFVGEFVLLHELERRISN